MRKYIIQIKELIRKGYLRIFPLPQKVIVIVFVIVGLTLIGCATPKHITQLVHDVRVDTVYMTNHQYDSIYIFQERNRDYHRSLDSGLRTCGACGTTLEHGTLEPDTVFIKDVSIEYRYKLLRDTIRIVQRDSIPYEVTITEVKEITRPLTWYDHLCRISLWFIIGFLSFAIYKRFKH